MACGQLHRGRIARMGDCGSGRDDEKSGLPGLARGRSSQPGLLLNVPAILIARQRPTGQLDRVCRDLNRSSDEPVHFLLRQCRSFLTSTRP